MRKLAFVSLAALAAAALPAAADAQPRAGTSWGQPGQQQRVLVRQSGPGMHQPMPGMEQRRFRQVQRFNRGQFIPSFWWGPQFQVQNWQMYGFGQPMPGHRWVRYYDDAYMIDGRGRVHEGRYGLDWDRYGDRWAEDERGIPVYVGDGDWAPNQRDEEWAEEVGERRGRGGWDYAEYGRGEYGPGPGPACAPRRGPCGGTPYPAPYGGPAPAYGYGGGYGASYGYGMICCATVTITETIVETGGSSASYEVVEEEVVRERARRVHRRPAPVRRPIRGERG